MSVFVVDWEAGPADATGYHPPSNYALEHPTGGFWFKEEGGVHYFCNHGLDKWVAWQGRAGLKEACLHRMVFRYPHPIAEVDLYEEGPFQLCNNPDKMLVPGVALATKDGRRCGNAHIITTSWHDELRETVYDLLTDAGNKMRLTRGELESAFYTTNRIAHVTEVLKSFDRNGEFQ